MVRSVNIPNWYRSSAITRIKELRQKIDRRLQDWTPTIIEAGKLRIKLARQFGFCFGVENAISIGFQALAERPGRRLFLISEMIHNPEVNSDLEIRGLRFLFNADGTPRMQIDSLGPDDVVIVPAFGAPLETLQALKAQGINIEHYDATCPFVERVWKRAARLGADGYTIVIHGRPRHEETRATFSRSIKDGATLIISNQAEAELLAQYLIGNIPLENFHNDFPDRCSEGFDAHLHLVRIGVVNQTTMLAEDTIAISELLKAAQAKRYGETQLDYHFAKTPRTLCSATSENQRAVRELLTTGGDLALVVGGYNSSNTQHLADLCAEQVPTYFIRDANELISSERIRHLHPNSGQVIETGDWLPIHQSSLELLVIAGASCPDALVERVLERVAEMLSVSNELPIGVEQLLADLSSQITPELQALG